MHETAPALVQLIAIAIGVGILAQVLAERVKLPSIVFLLAFGVIVGPDVLGWIDPADLGVGLQAIVTVAVALILFEGGLELRLLDLAAVGRAVRNLVTIGVAITVAGSAVAAHWLLDFSWPLAFLFGAIVSVTGPTVIVPLLERVRVVRRAETILRGEGILIDPIGAILTVVVLDLVLTTDTSLLDGLREFGWRIGVGTVIGLAGGWVLGRMLRFRRVFADELKNLVVLAWVLVLFAASEALAGESGLAAVVIAGMAVRHESIPRESQLRRFKGELSVLFISMLFILLSAHLPLATLTEVGWRGVLIVVILMWIVRPISVFASTWGGDTTWRERLFVMWISPRGVVAISIASFIALRMQIGAPALVDAGMTGADGDRLLALVFLTIAITVIVQGLTANWVARLLGVNVEAGKYAVIVGANALGRRVGDLLKTYDWDVVLIDTNARNVRRARGEDLVARIGNVLDHQVQKSIHLDSATALIAITGNQAVNFLIAQIALEEHEVPDVYPVLVDTEKAMDEMLLERAGAEFAFGGPVEVGYWSREIERGLTGQITISLGEQAPKSTLGDLDLPDGVLPILTLDGDDGAEICHAGTQWKEGDRVVVLVNGEGEASLHAVFGDALAEAGEKEPRTPDAVAG